MPRASRKLTTGADVSAAAAPASAPAPVGPTSLAIRVIVPIMTRRYHRVHLAEIDAETGMAALQDSDSELLPSEYVLLVGSLDGPGRKVCRRCFPS